MGRDLVRRAQLPLGLTHRFAAILTEVVPEQRRLADRKPVASYLGGPIWNRTFGRKRVGDRHFRGHASSSGVPCDVSREWQGDLRALWLVSPGFAHDPMARRPLGSWPSL